MVVNRHFLTVHGQYCLLNHIERSVVGSYCCPWKFSLPVQVNLVDPSRDHLKEHAVTADKPSETSKVTVNLQISQTPGNGGVVNRRQRLERRCRASSERMKRSSFTTL